MSADVEEGWVTRLPKKQAGQWKKKAKTDSLLSDRYMEGKRDVSAKDRLFELFFLILPFL